MRFFIPFVTWFLFSTVAEAQVRNFSSPELKGVRKAFLETKEDGTEQLIGFWDYQFNRRITGGIVVLRIINSQLLKVWENNDTFSYIEDYDAKDINKDGFLDFVAAGSGDVENQGFQFFIALFLSNGKSEYQKHIFVRPTSLYNSAFGDINGDGQLEIVFIEQIEIPGEGCLHQKEIKIGHLQGEALLVEDTGIFMSRDYSAEGGKRHQGYWEAFTVGDVDDDGKDEAIIDNWADFAGGRFISVFNLEGNEKYPTVNFPRGYDKPYLEDLWVNKVGHIIELQKENPKPRVTSLNGTLSKIAAIELPEVDLTVWKPVQITMPVVLSELRNGDKTARQVTIYGPN